MAGEYNAVVSASDPSGQTAAIATSTWNTTTLKFDLAYVTAPGTMDTLFSNSVDLPAYTLYKALYIGVAGNIKYNDQDGNTVGPIAVPQGILPFKVRRIWATGTTVTQVVGAR